MDTHKMDVAGSLFTSLHRHVKIEGQLPPRQDMQGTGSCFDITDLSETKAGAHKPLEVKPQELPRWSKAMTQFKYPTPKPDPHEYLRKGEGVLIKVRGPTQAKTPSPPRAGATNLRDNPPNTTFRRFYERGDLPISVDHKSFKNAIKWKVDLDKLDYHHYLPIFFDGIREKQDPYRFLAIKGVEDLLAAGGARVLPVIPQLIIPIKTALNTRDPAVMCIALQLLQKLVASHELVGEALVPYYRQLLPVLNIYINKNKNLGDGIDYGQQHYECLGELIADTLSLLEQRGGEDAFINIKYLIPQYESNTRI